jgi:Arc/MetJ-type ribon-helix-helix transcriptional regulator
MARFIVSMPDEMLKQLDAAARREQRNRSELLREAVRRHLSSALIGEATAPYGRPIKREGAKNASRKRTARTRLLDLGIGEDGCPGLDRLIGPLKDKVDMRKALGIGKKLKGLSADIIDGRDDRL